MFRGKERSRRIRQAERSKLPYLEIKEGKLDRENIGFKRNKYLNEKATNRQFLKRLANA